MKLKVYKIIFAILLIIFIIVIILLLMKYEKNQSVEEQNSNIVEDFMNNDVQDITNLKINEYNVIGIISIPKIKIIYPILKIDNSNPEESKIPMKYGIVRYWGGNVNEFGNLSLAGHNNYDGTMFGKLKELENGDSVYLIDLNKDKIEYKICDKFITNPNDVSVLISNTPNIREVTLITCINGNRERLIFKAKQKI